MSTHQLTQDIKDDGNNGNVNKPKQNQPRNRSLCELVLYMTEVARPGLCKGAVQRHILELGAPRG